MVSLIRSILFSFLLLICLHTNAQSNYLFSYLGMQQGLAGEYVRQVQQDDKGYMWVLTRSCLQRYDGIRFLNIFAGKGILPQGLMKEMLIDKQNRLWVCFENNTVGYLNPSTFKWHPVQILFTKGITGRDAHFFESGDGKIMFTCTGENFLTFNEERNEFAADYNIFQLPEGWRLISLWQDKNNNYWASTYGGLVKYNPSNNALSYKGHNTDEDSYITLSQDLTMIQHFFIDKQGIGWITSWPATGLSFQSLDTKNGKDSKHELEIYDGLNGEYYTIIKMLEAKGSTWLYGDNLLALYDSANEKFRFIPKNSPGKFSISYDVINHIYEDKEHSMWISTNQGLYRYTPSSKYLRSFNNYTADDKKAFTVDVTGVLETTTGEIWVSTWGGNGLFVYDTLFKPIHSKILKGNEALKPGMVWSMVEMNNHDIWWGAQNGWLWKYDAAKKSTTKFQPTMVGGYTIRQVAKDAQDNLWIGVQGGRIIKYNTSANEWQLIHKAKSSINRMIVSRKNEVWASTDYDGLYRVQASTGKIIRHYTDTLPTGKKLFSSGAIELLEYNDSLMLIVSAGLNVLNLHTDSIKNNFEAFEIFNLETDSSGIIWGSTNIGLYAFALDHDKPLLKFDQQDGFSNFSFDGAAVAKLHNGTILFGNNHGFIAFEPEKLKSEVENNTAVKVQVSEVYVNDQYLMADSFLRLKKLKIEPGDISIRVRYTTNTFKEPLPVYYKLEGIDSHWKEASALNEVTLSYLSPGKYLLKAGIMNDNNAVVAVTELSIEIKPRFYQTEWFYILMLIIVLGILFLLDHYRMKRKEDVQQLRRNIAKQLHEEVSSTLEKVNILSDIAIMKHETDPVKSREFITEIKHRSSAMVSAMQDMLWAIAPENDSMKELLKRFNKYIQLTGHRFNMQIAFAADDKVSNLNLNMQLRYELLLLFKHSIQNLVNASAKDLRVYIGYEKNILHFIFQFAYANEDTRQVNNFFGSKELSDKLKSLNGVITSTVKAPGAEIVFTINL